MKLRFGDIHVHDEQGFDLDAFVAFATDILTEAWSVVEAPAGDPEPRCFVHLCDPHDKLWGTHVHALEHDWFATRPRVAELSARMSVFADLAPCRFIAIGNTGIVLSYEAQPGESHADAERIHDIRRAVLVERYGSLTKAWEAGEADTHEIAQLVVGSALGPASAYVTEVLRSEDAPPRLAGGFEAVDSAPDGGLIDAIQEALQAHGA